MLKKSTTPVVKCFSAIPVHVQGSAVLIQGACGSQSRQSAKLFSGRRNWDSPNPSLASDLPFLLVHRTSCSPAIQSVICDRISCSCYPRRRVLLLSCYAGVCLPTVRWVLIKGLRRDVVYLGWPIAPSYMSPNAGWGLRGLSQWVQLYTGAQINFGDLTTYLSYIESDDPVVK